MSFRKTGSELIKSKSLEELREFLVSYPRFIWMILTFALTPFILAIIVFLFLTAVKPTVIVPQMVGLSIIDANTLAQASNIKTLFIEQTSEYYPRYFVVAQDVKPGNSVKKDREVILYVSSGGVSHDFPSFVGKNIYLVNNLLSQADQTKQKIFISNINWQASDKPFGEIIDQSPPNGNYKDFPIGVTFTVSNASNNALPSFINTYAGSTLYYLTMNNINFVTQEKITSDPLEDGKILGQSPKEGTLVDKSDSIYLEVGRYKKNKNTVAYFSYKVTDELNNKTISMVLSDNKGDRIIYEALVHAGDIIIESPVVYGTYKCTIFTLDNNEKTFYKELE